MIIILDTQQQPVGVLDNNAPGACPYFNDKHTEALEDNLSLLEFEIPANNEINNVIEPNGYVIYTDLDNKKHLFIIKEITDTHEAAITRSISCENAAVCDLIGNVIRPTTLTAQTLLQALSYVLNGTTWTVGQINKTDVKTIVFDDYITSLEAIHILAEEYDAEIEFEAILAGSYVTEKLVHMVDHRGNVNTGKIFEYTKNLNKIQRVENSNNLITAIIPVGKADENENVMTIESYNPPFEKGFEKEQDYIICQESFQKYNKQGKNIFGIFKDDKATNQAELYQNGLAKLKELCEVQVTYSCDVVTFETITGYSREQVRIGDNILIRDFTYKPVATISARVVAIERSKSNPINDAITIGQYNPIITRDLTNYQRIDNLIRNKQAAWDSASTKATTAITEVSKKASKATIRSEINSSTDTNLIESKNINFANMTTIPTTGQAETGFAGIGGQVATASGVQFGIGVNFRVRKTYTPTSVTLETSSSTLSGLPSVADISQDGFWLFFQDAAVGLRYWRGTYTA